MISFPCFHVFLLSSYCFGFPVVLLSCLFHTDDTIYLFFRFPFSCCPVFFIFFWGILVVLLTWSFYCDAMLLFSLFLLSVVPYFLLFPCGSNVVVILLSFFLFCFPVVLYFLSFCAVVDVAPNTGNWVLFLSSRSQRSTKDRPSTRRVMAHRTQVKTTENNNNNSNIVSVS